MGRKRSTPQEPAGPGFLLVPREQLATELDEQIELGRELAARDISSLDGLEAARSDYYTWSEYNTELLKRRFTTAEISEEYSHIGAFIVGGYDSLATKISDYHEDVNQKIRRLESIRKRVGLFEEAASVAPMTREPQAARRSSEPAAAEVIFIVHGHNEAVKLAVQGFIRQVTELDPVVLHDEPSMGRTVIEKLEATGAPAAFAVVLLTADDEGRALGDDKLELKKRGRQNVVFEFGYFVGALGRPKTVVLYEPGVELPSDIQGLVYVEYDQPGGWKLLLARELKAAGIAVDANRLV